MSKRVSPIVTIGALFFIFGFVTWLNATLIPYLKFSCELDNFQSYLVTFSFYIAYFFLALPSSAILKRTGFKRGMSLGLAVMAVGALLFIPAAMTRTYSLFLVGLFVLGGGLSLLQTAANPYVAIIGPKETAALRISIMGICNKIAGAIAPLLLGAIVFKDADRWEMIIKSVDSAQKNVILQDFANRAIVPYICLFAILIGLSIWISFSKLPEVELPEDENAEQNSVRTSIFQYPNLIFGAIALFFYVGAEVIAVDTIANYGMALQIPIEEVKSYPTYTLLAMILGYLIGIILMPKYVTQRNLLFYSAMAAMLIACSIQFTSGTASMICVVLLGVAHAPMWPAIWALAIEGLGKFMKTGSSILIMAIAGGALLPLAYGKIADFTNVKFAYWILIPCYIVIGYYSVNKKK